MSLSQSGSDEGNELHKRIIGNFTWQAIVQHLTESDSSELSLLH